MFHAKLLYFPRALKRHGRPKAKTKIEGNEAVRLKEDPLQAAARWAAEEPFEKGGVASLRDVLSRGCATIASVLSTQIARGPMLLLQYTSTSRPRFQIVQNGS